MKEISEWEVLTPDGWSDFSGIVKLEKKVLTVKFKSGKELTGSETHRLLLKNGEFIELQYLMPKDTVISEDGTEVVLTIEEGKKQNVYDLVEVNSNNHRYFTNGIVSHNCDEMAFIPSRIQDEFMAGTSPALSATRGKMIVTSTPNGSRDLFAKLWFNSGMEWDTKEHSYVRKNEPKNEFAPLFIPYWIDPTKNNDEWIQKEKRTLDDPIKWKVEFECLGGDTTVEVFDEKDKAYKELTLEELYIELKKDALEDQVKIVE